MSPPMAIRFDTPSRVDHVTFAVVPIDGFTGALVRAGVRASIDGVVTSPIVNRSGMLVFLNLLDPPDMINPPAFEVEIDARDAGYFGPERRTFTPPSPNDPEAELKRQLRLLLKPRPDYLFPAGATLVRGVVVDGAQPVVGASVSTLPDQSDAAFETVTDARGAFALALRPSPLAVQPLEVDIHFAKGPDTRDLVGKTLTVGRCHSFREPIDLAGNNDPEFFTV